MIYESSMICMVTNNNVSGKMGYNVV